MCFSAGASERVSPFGTHAHTDALKALEHGNYAQSLQRSKAILAQQPDDFLAQYLFAFSALELGEYKNASKAAQSAYRLAPTTRDQFLAARVAANAKFRSKHFTQAEWWLRRAANKTSSPEEAQTVSNEFHAIRRQNPLSLRFGFSIAPSSNINGGTEERTFSLGEFDFIYGEGSRSLSGVEYAGNIDASYRLSESAIQQTRAGIYLFGRTYSLSAESQTRVPNASGSDYALGLAEVSLSQSRSIFDGLGPTEVSLHFGQVWYGGDPFWRYGKLSVAQSFPLGESAVGSLKASFEDQYSLNTSQPDTKIYDLQGTYAKSLSNQDTISVTLSSRFNDAAFATNTFTDHSATVGYSLAQPVLGSKLSLSIGVGAKAYDEFSLSLNGRYDEYITVGATALMENISFLGFSPSVMLSATKTRSNVTRFSTLELSARIGIQSNF